MSGLDGRGAVVTGGGRGIGAAVARALAGAGCRMMVAARSRDEVEAVAGALRAGGADAHAAIVDVADEASVRSLAGEATERLGAVDLLVNNAGVARAAPLHRESLEEWTRLLSTNVTGTFLCTRAFLPGMVQRGWGRVVNIASVAGLRGGRYISAYAASKHAVIGLTRSAAAEAAPHGVTVNAVCPSYVDTPMTDGSIANIVEKTGMTEEEARGALIATNPQRRMITAAEVAAAVLFLCGEEARGINGHALVIDGGGVSE